MRIRPLSHPDWIEKGAFILGILCLGAFATAQAQEVPRPSLAREYTQTTLPTIYNVKAGPVLFRVSASLSTEIVDNVNLGNGTTTPAEADLILNPQLGIDALWTITELNTLHLHATLGYMDYLDHPRLDSSSVLLSPDSALSFNVYIGDFKITLHDQFSYQENPVGEGAVANVEQFSAYTNDAGLQVLWDANDVISTLGYDHSNFIPTGAISSSGQSVDTSDLAYTTDEITGSVFFKILSNLGGGLEATASATSYSSDTTEDAKRASVGPFVEFQLSRYTKIAASGGYQATFFANGGGASTTTNSSGLGNDYYADLSIENRLNRFVTSQLSFGHDNSVSILSAETETTYARLTTTMQVAPQVNVSGAISYADADDSGSLSPTLGSTAVTDYQLITVTLSTGYQITKKLSATLQYQYIRRTGGAIAGEPNQNYTQNSIALILGYQF